MTDTIDDTLVLWCWQNNPSDRCLSSFQQLVVGSNKLLHLCDKGTRRKVKFFFGYSVSHLQQWIQTNSLEDI